MDDNPVCDQLSDDDDKNSIVNEGSDVDSLCDASSTTSLSHNEFNSSSSENDDYNEDLNVLLTSTITEEDKFINESYAEPSIVLFKVHFLLRRVRKLIKMIRNISTLHRYVVKQIKLFLENLNRQREAEKKEKIKFKEFTLDMKIRWCSSFVNDITFCFIQFNCFVINIKSI